MLFHISQPELADLLTTAVRAVPARTTIPALTGVLLSAGDGRLTAHATDLELAIVSSAPAAVERAGAALLPARNLLEIVRRFPPATVSVAADADGAAVTITCGSACFTINALTPEHFPALPSLDDAVPAAVAAAPLRRALLATVFAAAEDEARPLLASVQLTVDQAELRALATDGFRIALARVPHGDGPPPPPLSLLAPRRNVQETLRLLPAEGTIQIHAGNNLLALELPAVRVLTRLVAGAYPPVLDLVPRTFPTRLRCNRALLLAALERVSLLADPSERARPVTITPGGDSLLLTAAAPSLGAARETIPASCEGEALPVIFNAPYLLDGLRACAGEDVLLELSGPVTAARLTAPGDPGFLYILMPMRPPQG